MLKIEHMYLQSLSVLDFKNIEQAEFVFSEKLNCFLGDNGAGKTNLLDAIYYLSFTKGFFNSVDIHNIRHHCEMFMIQGNYMRHGERETISAGFKAGQKKQIKRNRKVYKKLSEHIGLFPLVMISPSDYTLITGGSDERRKFMDGVISQFDHVYLNTLLRYNRALLQRNNLLKQFVDKNFFDEDTLSVYDEQLAELGLVIHEKRKKFIDEVTPVFQFFYSFVSGGKEQVKLSYQSCMADADYRSQLVNCRRRDRAVQHSTLGVHRDDMQLELGDFSMKKNGSQGQQKTYLLALKLAQFEYLKNTSEIKPILLLDDIFDKLDSKRVSKIIELVSEERFGQIFITDTDREHLGSILKQMSTEYRIFKIENGKIEDQ